MTEKDLETFEKIGIRDLPIYFEGSKAYTDLKSFNQYSINTIRYQRDVLRSLPNMFSDLRAKWVPGYLEIDTNEKFDFIEVLNKAIDYDEDNEHDINTSYVIDLIKKIIVMHNYIKRIHDLGFKINEHDYDIVLKEEAFIASETIEIDLIETLRLIRKYYKDKNK